MNAWFVKHHSFCLVLMWIFTIAALAVGSYLAACRPNMDFFLFWGYIAIPLIPALYLRIIYGRYQQQKKAEQKTLSTQNKKKKK